MTISDILLVVIAILMMVVIIMAMTKKRWYLVTTAKPDKRILARRLMEWEVSGTAVFRDEENRRVILSKHWILEIVELRKKDVPIMKAQLQAEVGNVQNAQ